MFKKTIDKILAKALEKLFEVLINWLEKALNTDLDGDGDVGASGSLDETSNKN